MEFSFFMLEGREAGMPEGFLFQKPLEIMFA